MNQPVNQSLIEQFQQICDTNPHLNLEDIFALDTTLLPNDLYLHLSELGTHFAKQEQDLWENHFNQECAKAGLHNAYMLYHGQTQMRMSDAMKCFYFLITESSLNASRFDQVIQFTQSHTSIRYHNLPKNPHLSFPENTITKPSRKEAFYALEINAKTFTLQEIERPNYLSYPYYVARQFSGMLAWTELGDKVRKHLQQDI